MIGPTGGASISERELTEFFGSDARFGLLGAATGLILGLLGWHWFKTLGWGLVLVVLATSLGAALICWLVGYRLGPGAFETRLATAQPGERVPIELTVRAWAGLVVWPFLAVIPVLLGASLGRDEDDVAPEPVDPAAPGRNTTSVSHHRRDRPGRRDQVSRGKLQLESAPAGRDVDPRVVQGRRVEHGAQRGALADRGDPAQHVTGLRVAAAGSAIVAFLAPSTAARALRSSWQGTGTTATTSAPPTSATRVLKIRSGSMSKAAAASSP